LLGERRRPPLDVERILGTRFCERELVVAPVASLVGIGEELLDPGGARLGFGLLFAELVELLLVRVRAVRGVESLVGEFVRNRLQKFLFSLRTLFVERRWCLFEVDFECLEHDKSSGGAVGVTSRCRRCCRRCTSR
jgi:hypothetical protein